MPASSSAPIEPLASVATCKEPNAIMRSFIIATTSLAVTTSADLSAGPISWCPQTRAKPDKAVAAKADEAKTPVEMRKECARGHALLRMFCANESDGILTVQPAPKGQHDWCD